MQSYGLQKMILMICGIITKNPHIQDKMLHTVSRDCNPIRLIIIVIEFIIINIIIICLTYFSIKVKDF